MLTVEPKMVGTMFTYSLEEVNNLTVGNFTGTVGAKIAAEIVHGILIDKKDPKPLVKLFAHCLSDPSISICKLQPIFNGSIDKPESNNHNLGYLIQVEFIDHKNNKYWVLFTTINVLELPVLLKCDTTKIEGLNIVIKSNQYARYVLQ